MDTRDIISYFSRMHSRASSYRALNRNLVVLLPASLLIGVLASQAVDVATRVAARLSAAQVRSFSDVVELPVVASFLDGVRDRALLAQQEDDLCSLRIRRSDLRLRSASCARHRARCVTLRRR
jgi:hypothetical protein